MESDTIAYLNYQESGKMPDVGDRYLWGSAGAKPPEMPPALLLYRKLKMYAGKFGTLPFPDAGGYGDQPYLTMMSLEAVMDGIAEFSVQYVASAPASGESNPPAPNQTLPSDIRPVERR